MKIAVLEGHLTPTNKKHIKYLLSLDMLNAKINRTNYLIKEEEEIYTVWIIVPDNTVIFGEKIHKSKATFRL